MRLVGLAVVMSPLLMTVGCGGGAPDLGDTAAFTEAQEQYRANTSFENGVISIEARREDGSPRILTSAAHREYEWGTYLPAPPMPGFVNREWLLSENRHDGRTLLYTAVEWDDDNPADYLSAGWWLHYPPGAELDEFELADLSVFIDGPELDLSNPPVMPMDGTASYVGTSGGIYEYFYGSGWGELQGESQYVEFQAPIILEADFAGSAITGCIGCLGDITAETLHLWPILLWQAPDPDALPTDYELHLGPAAISPDGTFENADIVVRHPERIITQAGGVWKGQFSNVPDPDGNPRRVVGYSGVSFDEADGSIGSFESIFTALTPATVLPQ